MQAYIESYKISCKSHGSLTFLLTNFIFFWHAIILCSYGHIAYGLAFLLMGFVSLHYHYIQYWYGGESDDAVLAGLIDSIYVLFTILFGIYKYGVNKHFFFFGLPSLVFWWFSNHDYYISHSLWHVLGSLSLFFLAFPKDTSYNRAFLG